MKTVFFSLSIAIVAMVVSCQKDSTVESNQTNGFDKFKIPNILIDAKVGNLILPNGTKAMVVNDGASVKFEYPNGIKYFSKDGNGNIFSTESGSYTCTGSCNKGCDVFYVSGSFGCSSCDPSTISCTGKAQNNSLIANEVEGGFVNLNSKIRLLTSSEDLNKFQPAVSFLFDIPEIKVQMLEFNKLVHGVENPTANWKDQDNYQVVVIDLAGVAIKYLMPKSYFSKNPNLKVNFMEGSQISCTCKDTPSPGGCSKKSGMMYESCVSGACVSCNMQVNQQ